MAGLTCAGLLDLGRRGLRRSISVSSLCFNIYHQHIMMIVHIVPTLQAQHIHFSESHKTFHIRDLFYINGVSNINTQRFLPRCHQLRAAQNPNFTHHASASRPTPLFSKLRSPNGSSYSVLSQPIEGLPPAAPARGANGIVLAVGRA